MLSQLFPSLKQCPQTNPIMNINTATTTATHDTDINAGTLSELGFPVCYTKTGSGITNDVYESSGVGSNHVLQGPPIQVVGVALITEICDHHELFFCRGDILII